MSRSRGLTFFRSRKNRSTTPLTPKQGLPKPGLPGATMNHQEIQSAVRLARMEAKLDRVLALLTENAAPAAIVYGPSEEQVEHENRRVDEDTEEIQTVDEQTEHEMANAVEEK